MALMVELNEESIMNIPPLIELLDGQSHVKL